MDTKNDIFATREGKLDFVIALIVIAIFSILIYQFLFKTEAADGIDATPVATQIEEVENQYLYTNSTTYAATTIQTEAPYEVAEETAVVISDIDNSSAPVTIDTISKPVDDFIEVAPSSKTLDHVADSTRAAAQSEVEDMPAVVIEEKEEPQKVAVTDKIAINCVVVVGVFKEESNKTAIIDKLESLGHEYVEGILRENLRYVGVPVKCDNEQDREKLLSELNQDFGIDSWVMRLKVQ